MKFFLSTVAPVDPASPPPCTGTFCRYQGHTTDHICLTSEQPVAGLGPHVYSVNLSAAEVKRYGYENDLRPHRLLNIALPLSELRGRLSHAGDFGRVARRPWDSIVVTVDDSRSDEARHRTRVWASRPGVADAIRLPESWGATPDPRYEGRRMVFANLLPGFDPSTDFIIAEYQTEHADGTTGGFRLSLIAGTAPAWAIFPLAWARWVRNGDVRESAIGHILSVAPEAEIDVTYARAKTGKANLARAWKNVANEAGRAIGRSLGNLNEGSLTDVLAMPVRIAQRIGGWTPPRPKPEFAAPAESGRILIADHLGPTDRPVLEEARFFSRNSS